MRKFKCTKSEPDYETGRCGIFQSHHLLTNTEQKLTQAVKRLVHLTHLTIYFEDEVPVLFDGFLTMMDNFTSLVHLDLDLFDIDLPFDRNIDQLVRQNPGLRHLSPGNFEISDAALTSIGRLRDLRHLRMLNNRANFTVNGVLTLPRSGLRFLLTFAEVIVEMTDEVRNEISDEIDLIDAEREKFLIRNEVVEDSFTFEFED